MKYTNITSLLCMFIIGLTERTLLLTVGLSHFSIFNLLIPKIDHCLISPYSSILESFVKIMRLKEMIASLISIDC